MKTSKFFLFIGIMFISVNFYAGTTNGWEVGKKDPFSAEISQMLSRSSLEVEKDFTVKVIFTTSKDKVIQIQSITSSNLQVNEFLQERLNGKQLQGINWIPNKIYELPVKVKAVR